MWGIVGVLIGSILTLLLQFLLASRLTKVAILNDHAADISNIEKLATEYWLEPGQADADQEKVRAAKLKGAVHSTASFAKQAEKLFRAKYKEYKDLDFQIFDATTGGDFETTERAVDADRVVRVILLCSEMRAMLRSQRSRLYWAY